MESGQRQTDIRKKSMREWPIQIGLAHDKSRTKDFHFTHFPATIPFVRM
jgi:hypothetical protein